MSKLYFTADELNQHRYPLPPDVEKNVTILIERLSLIREAYGRPMIITSGYRSKEDQMRIYAGKVKVPMGSAHLIGAAADVSDRDRSLAGFCYANISLLEKVGLWCEDPTRTPTWLHFQIYPPASGSRFFLP